jgi:tetratricopeptide (TPR) repeat protein
VEDQQSATLRVPLEHTFGSSIEPIERGVRNRHANDKINRAIAQMIRAPIGLPADSPVEETFDVRNYVRSEVTPRLERMGLAETGEEDQGVAYTPDQVAFRERVVKAGSLATVFKDSEAAAIVADLEASSVGMPPKLRAAFYNLKGLLETHNDDLEKAVVQFELARSLNAEEQQILINLLTAQYALFKTDSDRWSLSNGWEGALDKFLEANPKSLSGVRLKMWMLSETAGANAAAEFLNKQSLSEADRKAAEIALAEFYMFGNDPQHALDLLNKIDVPPKGQEAHFFGVKAQSLVLMAIPGIKILGDGRVWVQGLGPTDVDFVRLQEACNAYEQALIKIGDEAPPHLVEQIYSSAAYTWFLRGNYDRAIQIADAFLLTHPNSQAPNAAMAAALFQTREVSQAVPFARKALDANDPTGTSYRNLLLILMASDYFDDALDLVERRSTQKFFSSEEENLSYQIAAIAHAEIGNFEEAHQCLALLSGKEDARASMTLAEVEVWRRENRTSADLLARLRAGLEKDPSNPFLLTALVRELGWPNESDRGKADEMISAINTISRSRQLLPVEFAALGHSYLVLDKVDDAERVFRSAIARYPQETRFTFERAQALTVAGREDEAYVALGDYLRQAKGDSLDYRNAAFLALTTDRLDVAIKMLQIAVSRSKEPKERGELHSILWELKRRRGDSPKEILAHAMEFGRIIGDEPDLEARFLMMCLLTPLQEGDRSEPAISTALVEFRGRLTKFTTKYPNHRALTAIEVPVSLSDREQAEHFMQEVAYLTLPRRLAAQQMELSARGGPWPGLFAFGQFC